MQVTWEHIKSAIRGMIRQGATDEQIRIVMSDHDIEDMNILIKELRKEIEL